MPTAYAIVIIYLLIVNLCSFALMGIDKQRAKAARRQRRIPEQRLFLLSAIGGAAGTMLGMRTWRHKTKHRTFTVGVPFLLGFNLLLLLVVIWLIGMNVAH
jgi:uncharacterized membrane protein YsdA (DUF1294 family)